MTSDFVIKLELEVKKNFPFLFLAESEKTKPKLLLAVSGGADSLAMLLAFVKLKKSLNVDLSVLTVNHHLRSEVETNADADFVIDLCKELTVDSSVAELSAYKIYKYAKKEKCGLEAAARHFRYKALHKRKAEINADYILLAHNKNDYYETVLMRFFQGGNPESLDAIKPIRGQILRPILNFSRAEILSFLKSEKQDYRNDSTNKNTKYLRNRLRLKLIPILDECFPNWRKSLDKSLEKITWDCKALELKNYFNGDSYKKKAELIKKISKNEVQISAEVFSLCPKAIKRRLLMEAFSLLGLKRLSHNFIKACTCLEKSSRIEIGVCALTFSDKVYVYKKNKKIALAGFSLYVETPGCYNLPFVKIFARESSENKAFLQLEVQSDALNIKDKTPFGLFEAPFYIRSIFPGDRVKIAKDASKSIKKIIRESNVSPSKVKQVALIEKNSVILGIWGALAGGKNRIFSK